MVIGAISLAFTTYQAGKLFFIGLQSSGKLSVFERTFERSMGLFVQGSTLWLSTIYQLWRFENTLDAGQTYQGYDALYVPQQSCAMVSLATLQPSAKATLPMLGETLPWLAYPSLDTTKASKAYSSTAPSPTKAQPLAAASA